MERAVCPDCGETVGGAGHRLTAGNRQDREMEQLSAGMGMQRSPWRWNDNV